MKRWLGAAAVLMALVGAFLIGRTTAPRHSQSIEDALDQGMTEGIAVGRAGQIGDTVAPGDKAVATKAFQSGYRAGLLDAFGNFDGGWAVGTPYIVTLEAGTGDDPYRFAFRELMAADRVYTLCGTATRVCAR